MHGSNATSRRTSRAAERATFRLRQYELLFEANEKANQFRWAMVKESILLIFGFYGFLFGVDHPNLDKAYVGYLIWLPVPVFFLGMLASNGYRRGMIQRGTVLSETETKMRVNGWELARAAEINDSLEKFDDNYLKSFFRYIDGAPVLQSGCEKYKSVRRRYIKSPVALVIAGYWLLGFILSSLISILYNFPTVQSWYQNITKFKLL